MVMDLAREIITRLGDHPMPVGELVSDVSRETSASESEVREAVWGLLAAQVLRINWDTQLELTPDTAAMELTH